MTRHARGWLLAALACITTAVATPAATAQQQTAAARTAVPAQLRGLEDYVERGMRAWKIPGLAMAIVRNDSVIYARGFGVREVGKEQRVDERTLFAIGSTSKAFTAAAIGMFVDDGKAKWDDPATKYLPNLQLFDPYVTRQLTVRDLLTHRSGLGGADLLWYGTDFDREEILRRVRFLEPASSFRSQFGYQNIMYLAAGEVVEALSGKSWDEFVDERIFTPLGMTASNTSVSALKDAGNVASPHTESDSVVRAIPYRNIDNIAPAGSINSNVMEMAQWVRLHLGRGTYEGKKVLSPEVVREMQEPQTIIRRGGPPSDDPTDPNFLTYGLGWGLQDYRGRKVVQHAGGIDGMQALVAMLPSERLGLVILTNRIPNALTTALMRRVFDAYLGVPATDWSARLLAESDSLAAVGRAALRKMEAGRVQGTRPSLALDKYAGTYSHPMYGDITVTHDNGRLAIRRMGTSGTLEHWHFDTFRVNWGRSMFGTAFASFTLDASAQVAEVSVQGLADFKRAPAAATAAASR